MSHTLELPQEPHFNTKREGIGFHTFSAHGQFPSNERHFHSFNLREPYYKIRYGGQQSGVENSFHNNSYHDNGDNNLIPLPDWPVAMVTWGRCWEVHVYGFSVLYLVLTVLCAAIFVRFRLRVKRFKIVYNTLILMATAGIFRAVFMVIDPYGYKGRMAGLMVGIMTQAVYPLFCACYGLTQVMLLRITNVNVGRSRLRTLSCLMGCTLTYLFLVVIIETVVFYHRSAKLLLLLDSSCFIVWSLGLGITFICSGFRLTQYATETKKAHKELNAFCNNRRSASNTTWLSAISNEISDTSPTTPDAQTLSRTVSPTTSYSVLGDTSLFCSSPTFVTPTPQFPTSSHRCHTHPRLSRPRLKISNQNHMTVTIATDDDDESTSSTDVDGPRCESAPKHARRVRKSAKQKYSNCKSHSKSKTPTSISIYRAVSGTEESSCRPVKLQQDSQTSGSDGEIDSAILLNSSSLSTTTFPDTNSDIPANTDNPHATTNEPRSSTVCQSQQNAPSTDFTASSNQIDTSPSQHPQRRGNIATTDSNKNMDNFEELDVGHEDISPLPPSSASLPGYCPSSSPSCNIEIRSALNIPTQDGIGMSSIHNNEQTLDNSSEPPLFSPSADVSTSLRENGYLADTENTFMSSAFSRLSSSLRRKLNPRSDVSSVRSSSCDSHDSPASPVPPERMLPTTPASLGLFRIRQSGMVQRAVHLTYLLTFLFLFACLLQLYTVFGVYGVLGSIRKPDPWPWLIFHTIFRATEVSIGLNIASIAFITLNYRHQRARRRYQQQQHHLLAATRDCIV